MKYVKVNAFEIDENLEKIANLLNISFAGEAEYTVDFLKWKYLGNPCGKSYGYFCHDGMNLVGLRLVFRCLMDSGNGVFDIHQPADSAVSPSYQGMGIFGKLNEIFLSDYLENHFSPSSCVINFPNENSVNTYLRLGWGIARESNWEVVSNFSHSFAKAARIVSLSEWSNSNTSLPKEYFEWRFSRSDRNYVFLITPSSMKFAVSVEKVYGLNLARVVYIPADPTVNDFKSVMRTLLGIGIFFSQLTSCAISRSGPLFGVRSVFHRSKKLRMAYNPNLSVISPPSYVPLHITDFF